MEEADVGCLLLQALMLFEMISDVCLCVCKVQKWQKTVFVDSCL